MHSKIAKRIMEKEERKFTRSDLYTFAEHMMLTFASKPGRTGMMEITGEDAYRIKMLIIEQKKQQQLADNAEKELKEKEERVKKILIELDELKQRQILINQQIHEMKQDLIRNSF
jgi:ABC-type phosphate transport system auxiliary subunit